jgi:hypothetical protein
MSTRKFFAMLLLAILLVITLGSPQTGQAQGGVGLVDQANVVTVSLYDSIQYFSPIGQSFIPALPGLDTVELWTEDFTWNNGHGVDLFINIREGNIYGPILGTSHTLSLPDNFHGVTHFSFPSLVSLRPGKVHVMEVVVVNGDNWVLLSNWSVGSQGGPNDTYPRGNWILNGREIPGNDLWFQEGLASMVPQSTAYCRNNLWSSLTRPNGKRFKNMGDCMQFTRVGK